MLFSISINVIIILLCHIFTLVTAQEQVSLIKCKNSDPELKDTLEVPKHLMEPENTAIFKLSNNSEKMNCQETEYVTVTLALNESLHDPDPDKIVGQFTEDGILMVHTEDNFIHYRQTRDYCIKSAGDFLNISVCEMKCGRGKVNSKKSGEGTTKLRPCIHKCCQNPHEIFYLDEDREIGCRYPNVSNKDQSLKPFLLEDINKKFSLSQLDAGESPNYFADKNFAYCDANTLVVLQVPKNLFSLDYYKDLNVNIFRLSKNGTIESCANKQWVELGHDDLCVDGLQNFGEKHDSSKDIITLMAFRCLSPNPSGISAEDDSNNTKIQNRPTRGNMRTTLLYSVSLPIACFFLFVTLVVYLLLWDKQNIHGKTVFCYIASLFLFFIFLCLSQAWQRGSKMCYLTAVAAHFSFILTFSWLTAINFDIYWTFRKLQVSSKVKNNKQFLVYAAVCLTVPCIFIIIGISLDKHYGNIDIPTCTPDDETSYVRTPQYGVKSCYISESAQGWYDYFIGGILLACNVVFFNLTVYRLCQHRKSAKSAMKSSSQEDKPVRLFGKLLAVMGAGWIFEFIGWAIKRSSNESSGMLWVVYICDCVTLLQAVALFGIFVCKRQIFVQLWQKYDNLRWILSVFTRNGCCEVPIDRKNTLTNTNQTGTSGTLGRSTLNRSNSKYPESPELTPLTMTNRTRKLSLPTSEIK